VPNLALRPERAPNGAGATLLGYTHDTAAAFTAAAAAALVLVLDEADMPVDTQGALIYAGTVLPAQARNAEVVLPLANTAEEDGTFVNRDGRVQRYVQGKPAPGMARPAWWVLGELGAELEGTPHPGSAAEVFDALAASVEAFAGLSYGALGLQGRPVAARAAVTA
jgi:NADH dehydrogenase/NADH:ubiquinone oxidoreductase subunit G